TLLPLYGGRGPSVSCPDPSSAVATAERRPRATRHDIVQSTRFARAEHHPARSRASRPAACSDMAAPARRLTGATRHGVAQSPVRRALHGAACLPPPPAAPDVPRTRPGAPHAWIGTLGPARTEAAEDGTAPPRTASSFQSRKT